MFKRFRITDIQLPILNAITHRIPITSLLYACFMRLSSGFCKKVKKN
nr:MAG TPA: hypothetical protein [Bacteriophage sp.]